MLARVIIDHFVICIHAVITDREKRAISTFLQSWSNLLHKKYRFCLTVPSPSKTRHVVLGY